MSNTRFLVKGCKAGSVLGAVVLVTLTGCVGYVERPHAERVYVAPPVVETTVVVQDNYVYYPGYNVYYNSNRRQYAYQERGAWVARPAPRGVSVEVLRASPSVRMDFHDSPAYHHAATVRKYPKNWAPPGLNQGQRQNRQDDRGEQQDERREKNRR